MTRPKDSDEGSKLPQRRRNTRRSKGHDEHPSEQKDSGEVGVPLQQDQDVDRTIVHRQYLERRLQGGAPATPEAYERAIEQWQQLPGAIAQVPVINPTPTQAAPTPTDTNGEAPASDAPDKEQQS
jgi:hypothetical protein